MWCSLLSHKYEEACEGVWKVSDTLHLKVNVKRCERCKKYKMKITLLYKDEQGDESSVTITTSAKTIKFLDGTN